MQDIRKMLRLNLEIEGCLRILLDRPNAEAEEILIDKLDQLRVLAGTTPEPSEPSENSESSDNSERSEPAENSEYSENSEPSEPAEPFEPSEPAAPAEAPAPIRLENALAAQQAASCFAKAFSVNDKYRFIREIFGNSAAEFNNAIDMVGAMKSLDEAYDYFLNDLGWDADNEAVSDYLVIVANHFNSAR